MSDPSTAPVPPDNPAVIAHINLLQGIITRLAGNSASCKTWCVSVVGALLALYGALHAQHILAAAAVPAILFACLDAAYLAQERLYRDLFNAVAGKLREGHYHAADLYAASVPRLSLGAVWWAFWSWSVAPIYAGLALGIAAARWAGWLLAHLWPVC